MTESALAPTKRFAAACLFLGPALGVFSFCFFPRLSELLEAESYATFFTLLPWGYLFGLIPAGLFYFLYQLSFRWAPPVLTTDFLGRAAFGALIGAVAGLPLLFLGKFAAELLFPASVFSGSVCAAFFGDLGRTRDAVAAA